MTQNEKKILTKFKEIKQANTVTIAGTLRASISYGYDLCKKLCEKGYLEQLSPGRFALYKITSLGEEQVKGDVQSKIEGIGEYECVSCGTAVKEEDMQCPQCGIIFEEDVEEEVAGISPEHSEGGDVEESFVFAQDRFRKTPETKPYEETLSDENVGKGAEILNHPSVPQDWKTCNWKGKNVNNR